MAVVGQNLPQPPATGGGGGGGVTDVTASAPITSSGGATPNIALTTPLTVPNGGSGAATLTGVLIGNGAGAFTAVAAPAGTIVGTTDTQTLTNKRITRRVNTVASSATPSINVDTTDLFTITALAVAITSMTTGLSGTPTTGQFLETRILDNGTARAITWGASFVSRGATLPTTTVLGKYLRVFHEWNEVTSLWECISVSQEV